MDPKQTSLKLMRTLVHFGHTMGYTPYCWPELGKNLQYRSSVYRKVWQTALLVLLVFYLIFLNVQLGIALMDQVVELKDQFGLIYITVGSCLMSVNHYTQVFVPQEYVQFMNGFRAFMITGIGRKNLDHSKSRRY